MLESFKRFWVTFWSSMKNAYNKTFKEPLTVQVQKWRDTERQNFLNIFVSKLNNLSNVEATFDVVSDSEIIDRLKFLCKSLEGKRYDITSPMLADGDFYVFPAIDSRGELYHSYLTQAQVRIVNMDGERITEAYGIIEWYLSSDGNEYYLLRKHQLDNDGTLHVAYQSVDRTGKPSELAKWEYINGKEYAFVNANHIGFGRYKSPANSRGLSPVYGVPLNFGCADIEDRIFEAIEMYRNEHKNAESLIFADPLILKEHEGKYKIRENIFAINRRAGMDTNIEVYNPSVRESEYETYLTNLKEDYEKQVGTDRGFLTPYESTTAATATEIRRANASTIALIDKIHNAIDEGNRMTLEADCVFLNIALDLWSYQSDWYDPFEDADAQWARLLQAKQNGAAETSDLVRWVFPDLTADAIEEKIERITEAEAIGEEKALDRILSGR